MWPHLTSDLHPDKILLFFKIMATNKSDGKISLKPTSCIINLHEMSQKIPSLWVSFLGHFFL